MNSFKNIFILFCLLSISACEDSLFDDNQMGNNPIENPITVIGHLNGLVVDENQNPVSAAKIEFAGRSTQSDENGFFRFAHASVPDDGGLIKITKAGYYDGYKFGFLETSKNAIVKIQLVIERSIGRVSSTTGGNLNFPGGATLVLPANGVVLESGGEYTGEVQVNAHYFDPKGGLNLAETMPGDLRGIDENGDAVQLVTYGMVAVELIGENREELQLKEGKTARLSFPLSSSITPDEIPMWFLDEETGIWNEEGLATKEGENMIAEVSHFSYWNCDYPGRIANMSGVLVTEGASPIAGHLVLITGLDNNMSGYGYTNEDGQFTGLVPADIPLSLSVGNCQDEAIEIGQLDDDTFLGDIVRGDENMYRVKGQLLDCQLNPNPNAYLYVKSENGTIIILPDANGFIDDYFVGCGPEEVTLLAVDIELGKISDPIIHQYTNNEFNFGTIETCEGEQFVSYLRDGRTFLFLDAQVTIVDGTHVSVFAKDPSNGDKVKFVYKLDPNAERYEIYSELDNGFTGGSGGFQTFEMNSPPVTKVGDLFSGTLTVHSSIEQEIMFRLFVDEVVTTSTLALKAWNDVDGNGIHDNGEEVLRSVAINVLPKNNNLEFSSYLLNLADSRSHKNFTDDDGMLYLYGIIPNTEHYLVYKDFSQNRTPTLANQGTDDSLDSDFRFINIETYHSQDFKLTAGEVRRGIDIGILP